MCCFAIFIVSISTSDIACGTNKLSHLCCWLLSL